MENSVRRSLRETLSALNRSADGTWLDTLEARKRAEATFHDDKVDRHGENRDSDQLQESRRHNKQFYSTVAKSKHYTYRWIEQQAAGRVVLDYACGQGELALRAARAGAELAIGLDISKTSILNARVDAHEDGLTGNTLFVQGDCERTGFPNESIDVMICSGMLHHLDVDQAFPEMRRILKPGGVCLAIEALNYNPAIKIYRWLTPKLRTDWESHHILSHKELRLARRYFDVCNVKYWHLFSTLAAPLRKTPFFKPTLAIANALDTVALKCWPVSYMAWQVSFELRKSDSASVSVEPQTVQPNTCSEKTHDRAA